MKKITYSNRFLSLFVKTLSMFRDIDNVFVCNTFIPIRPKVLVSKIKALLRRQNLSHKDIIHVNQRLTIDKERYLIIKDGEKISLPRKEFEIISLLASKPQKVFTREEIYEHIWGKNIYVGDRTIDVHIRKIRKKIGDNLIKTVKGVGYKIDF